MRDSRSLFFLNWWVYQISTPKQSLQCSKKEHHMKNSFKIRKGCFIFSLFSFLNGSSFCILFFQILILPYLMETDVVGEGEVFHFNLTLKTEKQYEEKWVEISCLWKIIPNLNEESFKFLPLYHWLVKIQCYLLTVSSVINIVLGAVEQHQNKRYSLYPSRTNDEIWDSQGRHLRTA